MTATLDLAAFRERFRDWIDLGKVELAGQGKLDGRYRRQGEEYRAGVERVVPRSANRRSADDRENPARSDDDRRQDRRPVDGVGVAPVVERSFPSTRSSGETELTMSAQPGAAAGRARRERARVDCCSMSGRQHRLEGELKAKSSQRRMWTTDRLAWR